MAELDSLGVITRFQGYSAYVRLCRQWHAPGSWWDCQVQGDMCNIFRDAGKWLF